MPTLSDLLTNITSLTGSLGLMVIIGASVIVGLVIALVSRLAKRTR
jgi:hypothetical protein